jgi:hypothetical protein
MGGAPEATASKVSCLAAKDVIDKASIRGTRSAFATWLPSGSGNYFFGMGQRQVLKLNIQVSSFRTFCAGQVSRSLR